MCFKGGSVLLRKLDLTMKKRALIALSLWLLAGCTSAPTELTPETRKQRVESDLNQLFNVPDSSLLTLSMHEAVGLALKQNLNYRIQLLEEANQQLDKHAAERKMLPQILFKAGYFGRSNDPRHEENGAYSVGRDQHISLHDVTFTWNALDFGLSEIASMQHADKVLIKRERRRQALQNLVEEVRHSYWRAVVSDRLLKPLDQMIAQLEQNYAGVRQLDPQKYDKPLLVIEQKQRSLERLKKLQTLRTELVEARVKLANLLHLKSGAQFRTFYNEYDFLDMRVAHLPLPQLERTMLANRSEIRESDYAERISANEVRKASIKTLPALGISADVLANSDQYLLKRSWMESAVTLSWSLLDWANRHEIIEKAEMQTEQVKMRRLIKSMAALMQLRLALESFHQAGRNYQMDHELMKVKREKMKLFPKWGDEPNILADVQATEVQADALAATIQQGLAHADSQIALGRLYQTLGYDFVPLNLPFQRLDFGMLAKQLAQRHLHAYPLVASGRLDQAVTERQKQNITIQPVASQPAPKPAQKPVKIRRNIPQNRLMSEGQPVSSPAMMVEQRVGLKRVEVQQERLQAQ
uniref:Outer membrane efflux protein n=1 Tax=Magnetococcus massalia (strain MO-1) TaxID=451514 RepID=A0A1S7LM07_MAGMO|nr:Conserved outer membrane protein of unknown function [Candidatus Magnetococcus massalia]